MGIRLIALSRSPSPTKTRMPQRLALVVLALVGEVLLQCANECVLCREVSTGSWTGKMSLIVDGGDSGCLYRRDSDGAFLRFCDPPNLTGDMYTVCEAAATTECVDPPAPAHYGYSDWTYVEGNNKLEDFIPYTCLSPKNITGVAGNELTIFCAATTFPLWQYGQSGETSSRTSQGASTRESQTLSTEYEMSNNKI